MNFTATSLKESNDYIGDEAGTNTNSDVVGKWHQDNCEEGWNRNSKIIPINVLDSGHHQEANDDKCWSCCFVRDNGNERSEESC